MTDNHDLDRGQHVPERSIDEIKASIFDEILASDESISSNIFLDEIPRVESWETANPTERHLAESFYRARRILQAISYGGTYWRVNFHLNFSADKTLPGHQHPGVQASMTRLFQLIVLSRATVQPVDSNWILPNGDDIARIKHDMRQELSVAELYDAHSRSGDFMQTFSEFPGVEFPTVVDSLMTGKLKIGNMEQPDPVLWRP